MVDTASAEKEHRRSKEDRSSDHAGRCCGEGYEHNSRSKCERSHPSMQPTAQPRLDCLKHLGQRILGVVLNRGLGWLVFPNLNGGQGFSFRGRGTN